MKLQKSNPIWWDAKDIILELLLTSTSPLNDPVGFQDTRKYHVPIHAQCTLVGYLFSIYNQNQASFSSFPALVTLRDFCKESTGCSS